MKMCTSRTLLPPELHLLPTGIREFLCRQQQVLNLPYRPLKTHLNNIDADTLPKDSGRDDPYLVVYPMDDISLAESEALKNVPEDHAEHLGAGNNISELAAFEMRCYEKLQVYEAEGAKPGKFLCLLRRDSVDAA
jgi:hypothetical protein